MPGDERPRASAVGVHQPELGAVDADTPVAREEDRASVRRPGWRVVERPAVGDLDGARAVLVDDPDVGPILRARVLGGECDPAAVGGPARERRRLDGEDRRLAGAVGVHHVETARSSIRDLRAVGRPGRGCVAAGGRQRRRRAPVFVRQDDRAVLDERDLPARRRPGRLVRVADIRSRRRRRRDCVVTSAVGVDHVDRLEADGVAVVPVGERVCQAGAVGRPGRIVGGVRVAGVVGRVALDDDARVRAVGIRDVQRCVPNRVTRRDRHARERDLRSVLRPRGPRVGERGLDAGLPGPRRPGGEENQCKCYPRDPHAWIVTPHPIRSSGA